MPIPIDPAAIRKVILVDRDGNPLSLGGPHPDLAAHDTLGLATQSELDTHAATSHGVTSHGALTGVTADQHHAQSHSDSDHSGANKVAVEKAGVAVGTRNTLNFIEGANVTLTIADDAPNGEVDITIAAAGGGGAPTGVDYLVGTADGTLTNEIVVGTTPGGELGGTWGSPTVDAVHSGSAHHAEVHTMASHSDDGALATLNTVGTTQIDDNAVTLAKLADIATARILGRVTAATGDPEALTGTQATTLLDVFTAALKGLVPASGGGTTTFLRADGTFATPTATASDPFYAPGSFTLATGTYRVMADRLELNGVQEVTLEGDATLVII